MNGPTSARTRAPRGARLLPHAAWGCARRPNRAMTARVAACAIALLVASASSAWPQVEGKTTRPPPTPPTEPAPRTPRPSPRIVGQVYVGEQAPDFVLDGSEGKPVKLSRLRGDWVLLVFCDRKEFLAGLGTADAELRPLGMQVVAVCNEKSRALQHYALRDSVAFLMLADVTGEISALYGLYDFEHSAIRPGFIVIDRIGTVHMAVLGQLLPASDIARLARFAMTGL